MRSLVKQIFVFVIVSMTVFGCCKDETNLDLPNDEIEDGVVISKRPLWYMSTSESGPHESGIRYRQVLEDGYLSVVREKDEDFLVRINAYTGEVEWKWNDLFIQDGNFSIKWPYLSSDIFIFQSGSRTYAVNVNDGTTSWKETRYQSFDSYIYGYKDNYFLRGQFRDSINNHPLHGLFRGEVGSEDIVEWLHPEFDTSRTDKRGYLGGVSSSTGFTRENIDYLSMSFGEGGENWIVRSYCALYDMTNENWIYSRSHLEMPDHSRNSVDGVPIVDGDRVYFTAGYHVVCHDLWTGEQIWRFNTNGNFVFGGFHLVGDMIYAQSEADAFYCLDKFTGDVCWRGPELGTTSKIVELNDVIYIVEGKYLYAFDRFDGTILWRIVSPDYACCDENFKREIAVMPPKNGKKGIVLTNTYLSAVAYEAIE